LPSTQWPLVLDGLPLFVLGINFHNCISLVAILTQSSMPHLAHVKKVYRKIPLTILFTLIVGVGSQSATGQSTTLIYIGSQVIPTGTPVGGHEIGGLSGISYNAYSDTFTAITNDSHSSGASRLWTLSLSYDGTNFFAASALSGMRLKT